MEEQQFLDFVLSLIDKKILNIRKVITETAEQVEYLLDFLSNSFKEMDDEEVVIQRSLLENEDEKLARMQEAESRLILQKPKPYFARFDFEENGKPIQKIYLGINNLNKDNVELPIVYDWRAPICSMYYDFELGKAQYENEEENIEGNIVLKRQYKIEDGKLKYYFDSSIMVIDEILAQELSKNSSMQMKSIIATIQKEQNQIIRNEKTSNLIIQGYAGSGKTSIAMHRVAYLLYKHKNLSSNEIIIISPNNIFSYYISGVLPEMGEKNILETTFLSLAKKELGVNFAYETREEMVEKLLQNPVRLNEANYKESFEFFENLKTFLNNYARMYFTPKDLTFGKTIITKQTLERLYFEKYVHKTPAVRIDWICDYVVDELNVPIRAQEQISQRVKRILYGMFVSCDILYIYREFLHAMNLCDTKENFVCYEDVAPLLFVKDFMFGTAKNTDIKHLVIDEMQDFSPIHFVLFEKMFPCNKTILGDIYQSLFKKISFDYLEKIASLIPNSNLLQLKKCYRSTKQIMDYVSNISNISDIESVNRQGNAVEEFKVKRDEYKATITNQIYKYQKNYKKVAIICGSQKKAEEIFVMLDEVENVVLIDKNTFEDAGEVLVMSTAFSKGLEFDAVIVLLDKFDSQIEKNLLYISTTRALHELCVVSLLDENRD